MGFPESSMGSSIMNSGSRVDQFDVGKLVNSQRVQEDLEGSSKVFFINKPSMQKSERRIFKSNELSKRIEN